ncbi:MAG: DUF2924 domain-containing protein, partial [Microcystis sp. LE19-12.2C]|nr:DUF2924 domain-containing protein [Microcystis sp. LE19-12.2C]
HREHRKVLIVSGRNGMRRPRQAADAVDLSAELAGLATMSVDDLRSRWRMHTGKPAPAGFSKDLIARALAYRLQEQHLGGLDARDRRAVSVAARAEAGAIQHLKVGSVILREYQGVLHEVMVVPDGLCWRGGTYSSLSTIAALITGTRWNGPRFFGLRRRNDAAAAPIATAAQEKAARPSDPQPAPRSSPARKEATGTPGRQP